MCGRFSIAVRIGIFARRFHIAEPLECTLPSYNIAPSEDVPVVVRDGINNRVVMMRWGLIPSRGDGAGKGPNPINARAEGLPDNTIYRDLLSRGRCIVPATGFYEWRADGPKKTPFYLLKKDRSLFAMAGLFDTWKDRNGIETRSFTIVTTTPNDLVAPLHNRMPVILTPEGEKAWTGKDENIDVLLNDLLVPYPSREMEAFQVSRSVNNPADKSETAVKPMQQKTLAGY